MSGENTQGKPPGFYQGFELLPVHLYVLAHLKKARVDYAKMMAKISGLPLELIENSIRDLLELGLIERDSGSAIKRSKAKFKKAFEVHKHHTYYCLSRKGELFVRSINRKWLRRYFNLLLPQGWKVVKTLSESRDILEVQREIKLNRDIIKELELLRFITKTGKKTDFFKRLSEFLEI